MKQLRSRRERIRIADGPKAAEKSEASEARLIGVLTGELERACRLAREGAIVPHFEELLSKLIPDYIHDKERAREITDATINVVRSWNIPNLRGHVIPDPRVLAIESITDDERKKLRAIWKTNKINPVNDDDHAQDAFVLFLIACRALLVVESNLPLYRLDRKRATRRTRYDPPANLKPSPQDEEAE